MIIHSARRIKWQNWNNEDIQKYSDPFIEGCKQMFLTNCLKCMIKATSLITLFNSLLMTSAPAFAQWWNPLAPRDYNECILKNMKEGMSEQAVWAVQYACLQKYPTKEDKKTKAESLVKDAEYKKCRIETDDWKSYKYLSIDDSNSYYLSHTYKILERLRNRKYDTVRNTIGFQNTNNFGVSAVHIGFTKAKSCPSKVEEFSYATFCKWGSTEVGVGQNTYGTLPCGNLPREAKSLGYCFIGYSPIYNRLDESLLTFLKSENYCN